MSDDLASGLAATANEPTHDTQPATPDAALDAVFDAPAEGSEPSDPSVSPEPAQEATADTTVQPQVPIDPKAQAGEKGMPPPERLERLLANARTKAKEDALAEHRDHLEVVAELKRDFPGTLARLLDEAAGTPQYSELIAAKAAAILAARKRTAQDDARPEPDQGDEKFVWYSPEQQAKLDAWKERQIEKRLDEKYRPLHQLQEQFVQHQQVQQAAKEAASVAEERGALWKTMPMFEPNKDAILKRQQEIYAEAEAAGRRGGRFDPINTPWLALQQAYSEVVSTQAIPKLQSQQTDDLVAQAARKRAGSSSDPAASAPAQPRRPRTPDEALDQVFGTA